MLGNRLVKDLSGCGELVGVDIENGDLADPKVCADLLQQVDPTIVVNAAAFTRVDDCETPEIYPAAHAANATLPANLAAGCRERNTLLVHVSSDYVYDGNKPAPYVETDPTGPLSAYGRTKLAGDEAIFASGCRYLILRTAWLFGRPGHNFVEAILKNARCRDRLAVVDDQRGCPTSTVDLAGAIRVGIEKELAGLFHLSCLGETTWHGFAKKICELAQIDIPIDTISSEKLGLPAPRPRNSVLDCSAFVRAAGISLRPWTEALAQYITSLP